MRVRKLSHYKCIQFLLPQDFRPKVTYPNLHEFYVPLDLLSCLTLWFAFATIPLLHALVVKCTAIGSHGAKKEFYDCVPRAQSAFMAWLRTGYGGVVLSNLDHKLQFLSGCVEPLLKDHGH